ncbi:hypothetical protein [Peribacillus acanthi]|uniref:hypothetical protein n=1 Tax=Peribacillus acanthi TaxID=2171554 RepID=UPI000D3E6A21|nr:hypothetical protein [Peribacillus acanthi]
MIKLYFKLLILFVCLSLVACSNENLEEVTIYDLVNGSEKVVLTDKKSIEIIKDVIKGANKQPGIVDMADPQYKINLGDEIYFLWLARSDGTIGTIMNTKDTHTIYTLSERSTTQLKELLLEIKPR